MPIFYALISKNFNIIISEYTDYVGNFQQITRILLYKLKNKFDKMGIIRYNKYIYSYLTAENLIFLCISNNQDDDIKINDNIYLQIKQKEINIIFSFLRDLKKYFYSHYTDERIEQLKSYEVREFDKIICSLMSYYNNKINKTNNAFFNDKIVDIDLRVENITDYLESYEIINIILIKNEFINNITLTDKNPLLSSYNCKKKCIGNTKIALKIIACIFTFFLLIYLLLINFGKKEDFD